MNLPEDFPIDPTTNANVNKNTFKNKREYEALRGLIEVRSENQAPIPKVKSYLTIWDKEPVDFSLKLYHPHPPKRNSREAIKPWLYDRFLKPIDNSDRENKTDENMAHKKQMDEYLSSYDSSLKENNENEEPEFIAGIRLRTAKGARMDAAKSMGYRDSLEQYKNPVPHDFRGLKPIYGAPEFKSRFESDPFNIQFLTKNLNKIHGLTNALSLRQVDPGLQMGDLVKKSEPKYVPQLILPRLSFPSRFYGFTRHRRRDRSLQSAYWDRVLPKLNEKWNEEKLLKT